MHATKAIFLLSFSSGFPLGKGILETKVANPKLTGFLMSVRKEYVTKYFMSNLFSLHNPCNLIAAKSRNWEMNDFVEKNPLPDSFFINYLADKLLH